MKYYTSEVLSNVKIEKNKRNFFIDFQETFFEFEPCAFYSDYLIARRELVENGFYQIDRFLYFVENEEEN